jgi:hypothetical protein
VAKKVKAESKTIATGTAEEVAGDVVDTVNDVRDTAAQVKELALLMKSFYKATRACLKSETAPSKKTVGACMKNTPCRKKYSGLVAKCVYQEMKPDVEEMCTDATFAECSIKAL